MIEKLPESCYTLTEGAEKFLPSIMEMVKSSIYSQDIFEAQAWQPANKKNLFTVLKLLEHLVLPNSKIVNPEHLLKLQALVDDGKSCIIMPEHYSNFDLPGWFYLVQKKYPELQIVLDKVISLAASKLNAESKVVLAFSEAFNRIMIYPARSKTTSNDSMSPAELEEIKQLEVINQRAIKSMLTARDEGKIILMFPSGTRYRPEKPESRNALEQSASFLKRFDYVCFMGIAGNTLIINPNNNMAEDIIRQDSMVYWIDEPRATKDFMNTHEGGKASKTEISEKITARLYDLHKKAEGERAALIAETPPRYLGPITSPEGTKKFIQDYKLDPAVVAKFMS